jgi:hypothetical protein
MILKTIRPSSSYQLELPEQVCQESDGKLSSFWLDGSTLLLQLSSYVRTEGEQVGALDRLTHRIGKHGQRWSILEGKIHPDATVDQATAEFVDEDSLLWIHSYIVWAHLTVYATISGPKELVRNPGNWAIQGLKTLRLTTH